MPGETYTGTGTNVATGETGTLTVAFTPSAPPPPPPPAHAMTFGVYTPANGSFNWTGLSAFPPVNVAPYYSGWGEGFQSGFAALALSHGATVFVEMEPWNGPNGSVPSMIDIAAGKHDTYLIGFAQAVKAFGHPVMVTFAHEMNGNWYPWGRQAITPAQWQAAWKHVVTVMRAVTPLIAWVWAPNVNPGQTAASAYWPGDAFADLVGIDGYLNGTGQTFGGVFGSTLTDVRAVTSRPIWVAETGIQPADGSRAARITKFAADARAAGLTGFMHFNQYAYALSAAEIAVLGQAVAAWEGAA
jgi:Glycosyl hydrolase family 26